MKTPYASRKENTEISKQSDVSATYYLKWKHWGIVTSQTHSSINTRKG